MTGAATAVVAEPHAQTLGACGGGDEVVGGFGVGGKVHAGDDHETPGRVGP